MRDYISDFRTYIIESKQVESTDSLLARIEAALLSDLVFIDTETTGLRGSKIEQLTQIAAVRTDSDFNEKSHFDVMIELNDGSKFDLELAGNDGSTGKALGMNHYADNVSKTRVVPEKEALAKFKEWLSQMRPVIFMQNAKFDLDMLKNRGAEFIDEYELIDLMNVCRYHVLPHIEAQCANDSEVKAKVESRMKRKENGMLSWSQEAMERFFGIEREDRHDALSDARALSKLAKNYIEYLRSVKGQDASSFQKRYMYDWKGQH